MVDYGLIDARIIISDDAGMTTVFSIPVIDIIFDLDVVGGGFRDVVEWGAVIIAPVAI